MGFQEAVRTCFQKYVVISGRAPRSEFWWWTLFLIIVNIVLGLLDGAIFGFGPDDVGAFGIIFSLATLLPSICVAGRRLHDRDMSAWWLLIGFIPIIGALVLLFFYLTKGTDGPNRFGPDPLGGGGDYDSGDYAQSSIPRSGQDGE